MAIVRGDANKDNEGTTVALSQDGSCMGTPHRPSETEVGEWLRQVRVQGNNTAAAGCALDPPTHVGTSTSSKHGTQRRKLANRYLDRYLRPHHPWVRRNQSPRRKVLFLQQNCHKASTVSKEIRDKLAVHKRQRFVIMVTEPYLGQRFGDGPRIPSGFPTSKNTFYSRDIVAEETLRACIIADEAQEMDLLPQFSSRDVTSVFWRTSLSTPAQGRKHKKRRRKPPRPASTLVTTPDYNSNGDVNPFIRVTNPSGDVVHSVGINPESVRSSSTASIQINTRSSRPRSPAGRSVRPRDTTPKNMAEVTIAEAMDDDYPSGDEDGDQISDTHEIILCSVYWDSQQDDLPKELVNLLEFAQQGNYPVILCGDFNAHSDIWGSPNSDSRGEMLETLSLAYDLTILNEGTRPTYERVNSKSHIDVSLVSESIAARFKNWMVLREETFSDHNRIQFKFDTGLPGLRLGRNLRKADWELFESHMVANGETDTIPDEWNVDIIEDQVSVLSKLMGEALNVVAPLKPRVIRHRSPHRDPTFLRARKLCTKLRRDWQKHRDNPIKYKAYRAGCQQKKLALRRADRETWKNYVSETADPNGAAKLMRAIRRDAYVPPTLLRNDGTFTGSKKQTVDLLLDVHFPGSQDRDDVRSEDSREGNPFPEPIDPPTWITVEKVRKAISSFSNFKACGPDEIKPIMLKHLPERELERLVGIYAACNEYGYIPISWRSSRTVFIPKPGKGDYTIPKAFRPISLTSFLLKTFERIALWHLECTTFRRHPFHVRQNAFRKGHSTENALSGVVNYIERNIYQERIALAVFLDIEGAFDNVNTEAAIQAMKDHGVQQDVAEWYSFYLKNRTSMVSYGERKSERTLTQGTPQGGVLSPILWNLVFDSLLAKFDTVPEVEIYGYADDACLLVSGYTTNRCCEVMQDAIDRCLQWGHQQGLRFSPTKTEAMFFHRKRSLKDPTRPLTIMGHPINRPPEIRYLGVYLDRALKWHFHLMRKISVAKKLLFKMKNALGITWGPKPYLLRWIYTGIVRPAIAYGCMVWWHAIKYKYHRARLKKLNALVLRMINPKRHSTPIAGLELIHYIPPIDLYIKGEAIKAFKRTEDALAHDWDGINVRGLSVGHILKLKLLSPELDLPFLDYDTMRCELHMDSKYTIEASSFDHGQDIGLPGTLTCYTDGSKHDEDGKVGVGCAFHIQDRFSDNFEELDDQSAPQILREESYYLSEHNTVFQAEATAIQLGAEYMAALSVDRLPPVVYVLSDSKSVLQALQAYWVRGKLLQRCRRALEVLAGRTKLILRWVKAHVGIPGNERADSLAKAAACSRIEDIRVDGVSEELNGSQVPHLVVPAPYSFLKKKSREGVEALWAKRFMTEHWPDGRPMYRQTKYFFKKPDLKKSYKLIRQDRESLGRMVQFITGHAHLRRHEALIKSVTDERLIQCRLCGLGQETPFHFVMECPEVLHTRKRFLKDQPDSPADPDCQIRWSAMGLVKFVHCESIMNLMMAHADEEEEDPYQWDDILQNQDEVSNAGGESSIEDPQALTWDDTPLTGGSFS